MKCPFCGYEDTKVIDSRPAEGKIRRRRECTNCGKRFTTYEIVEKPLLLVLKKDNSFEPFERTKLIQGLTSAVKKRPVTIEQITEIVDNVEGYYANKMQTQTTTTEIGDMVLRMLKDIDLVAYVRFASVYKDFTDVQSFINIISELKDKEKKQAQ